MSSKQITTQNRTGPHFHGPGNFWEESQQFMSFMSCPWRRRPPPVCVCVYRSEEPLLPISSKHFFFSDLWPLTSNRCLVQRTAAWKHWRYFPGLSQIIPISTLTCSGLDHGSVQSEPGLGWWDSLALIKQLETEHEHVFISGLLTPALWHFHGFKSHLQLTTTAWLSVTGH